MDATETRALEAVTVAIGRARPYLVDAWEATAVAESLGYTDARVRQDFGFADARTLGERIFERLSGRRVPPHAPNAADGGAWRRFAQNAGATWMYAVASL